MVNCECRGWCGPLDRTPWDGHHPNCPAIDEKDALLAALASFREHIAMLPDGDFKREQLARAARMALEIDD